MTITATAPAKVILFGEHAVVFGQPAIAIPVRAMRAKVMVKDERPGRGLLIHATNTHQRLRVPPPKRGKKNTLTEVAQMTLDRLKIDIPPDVTLTLESNIPMGSGLGSGAAVAAALARALASAVGQPFSNDDLNELVYEIEKQHHGTPSGIDNTVIVYEKSVYFVRGQPLENLTVLRPFTLLVADSGQSTPTYITVGDVRKLHDKKPDRIQPYLERIGEITRHARRLIETGEPEQLGALMNENHTLLQKLTVSSLSLDVLCEAAMIGGALGAKLSGGGRGGNMIALVTDETAPNVTEMLYKAGATQVIKTRISSD